MERSVRFELTLKTWKDLVLTVNTTTALFDVYYYIVTILTCKAVF